MTSAVTHDVPPQRLVHAVNPLVRCRIGWRAARTQLGLTVTVGRPPTVDELEEAVREYRLAIVTLRPSPRD